MKCVLKKLEMDKASLKQKHTDTVNKDFSISENENSFIDTKKVKGSSEHNLALDKDNDKIDNVTSCTSYETTIVKSPNIFNKEHTAVVPKNLSLDVENCVDWFIQPELTKLVITENLPLLAETAD